MAVTSWSDLVVNLLENLIEEKCGAENNVKFILSGARYFWNSRIFHSSYQLRDNFLFNIFRFINLFFLIYTFH